MIIEKKPDAEKKTVVDGTSQGSFVVSETTETDQRVGLNRRSGIDRRVFSLGVAGLNFKKANENYDGDDDLYYEILHSFVINTPALLEEYKDVNSVNIEDYGRIMHGIKGSSRSICADEFAGIAERLEKAAKDLDFDFIYQYYPLFLDAARDLMSGIEEMLEKRNRENPKEKTGGLDKKLLDKLVIACKAYDMNTVDAILDLLGNYEYEQDRELYYWLRDNADKLNLNAIIERLSSL